MRLLHKGGMAALRAVLGTLAGVKGKSESQRTQRRGESTERFVAMIPPKWAPGLWGERASPAS